MTNRTDHPVNEAALTHMAEAVGQLRESAARAKADADRATHGIGQEIARQAHEERQLEEAKRAVEALTASIGERAGWLISENRRAEQLRADEAAATAEADYMAGLIERERARAAAPLPAGRLVANGRPADTAPMTATGEQDGSER